MSKQTKSMSQGRCAARHTARLYKPNNVFEEMMEYNIHFKYQPVQEAFHEVFDDAIEKYNEKQSRNDRKKTDYYKEIVAGQYTEKDGEKVKVKNAPHPEYEYVFQFGNRETNPASILNGDVRTLGPHALLSRDALKEFFLEFVKENPNLHITGASIHMDEATPHLHVRFIPVAEGYKNGLEKRCSFTKALENMGFKRGSSRGKDLSLFRWQIKQEELLEKVGRKYGFEIVEGNSKGRERIETNNWKAGLGEEITQLEKNAVFYKRLSEAEEHRAERTYAETEAIVKECAEEVSKAKKEMDIFIKAADSAASRYSEIIEKTSEAQQEFEEITNSVRTAFKTKEEYDQKLDEFDVCFRNQDSLFLRLIQNHINVIRKGTRQEIEESFKRFLRPFEYLVNLFRNALGFEVKTNMPEPERRSPDVQRTLDEILGNATKRSEETNTNENKPNEMNGIGK